MTLMKRLFIPGTKTFINNEARKGIVFYYPFFMLVTLLGLSCEDSNSCTWETISSYETGNVEVTRLTLNESDSSFMLREMYKTGEIKSQYEYLNGNLEGITLGFYEDGTLALKSQYEKGKKHGGEYTYSPDGKLRSKFIYNRGIRIDGSFFFENGQPTGKLQFDSLGRVKDGVYYYRNGNVRSKGSFNPDNDRLKEGLWEYFYKNGRLRERGVYKGGEKRGNWNLYDSLGNKTMTVPYH